MKEQIKLEDLDNDQLIELFKEAREEIRLRAEHEPNEYEMLKLYVALGE